MNKKTTILIIAIILIVFIGIFGYKIFSIKLQENKEKEVIQAQLLKEKEILELKSEQKQIEKEIELSQLDSCIKTAAYNMLETGQSMGYYNPIIVMRIKNKEISDTDALMKTLTYPTEYHMSQGVCKGLPARVNPNTQLLID